MGQLFNNCNIQFNFLQVYKSYVAAIDLKSDASLGAESNS